MNALEKLKNSKLGQDVFTSIMLEMAASSEDENSDRINELLDSLYEDFRVLREN